jgi:hypothetical protein
MHYVRHKIGKLPEQANSGPPPTRVDLSKYHIGKGYFGEKSSTPIIAEMIEEIDDEDPEWTKTLDQSTEEQIKEQKLMDAMTDYILSDPPNLNPNTLTEVSHDHTFDELTNSDTDILNIAIKDSENNISDSSQVNVQSPVINLPVISWAPAMENLEEENMRNESLNLKQPYKQVDQWQLGYHTYNGPLQAESSILDKRPDTSDTSDKTVISDKTVTSDKSVTSDTTDTTDTCYTNKNIDLSRKQITITNVCAATDVDSVPTVTSRGNKDLCDNGHAVKTVSQLIHKPIEKLKLYDGHCQM